MAVLSDSHTVISVFIIVLFVGGGGVHANHTLFTPFSPEQGFTVRLLVKILETPENSMKLL